MQYMIYNNISKNSAYPYLVDVQSDIIDELTTRIVIPLYPMKQLQAGHVKRLNPVIEIEGEGYLVMTNQMQTFPPPRLGNQGRNHRLFPRRFKDLFIFSLIDF